MLNTDATRRQPVSTAPMHSPSWRLTWEVHNVLAPEPMHAQSTVALRNATDDYRLLGHFDVLADCQAAAASHHQVVHSFTWFLPSHRSSKLRGACFAITSRRWEPSIAGDVVSGRLLCGDTFVAASSTSCTRQSLSMRPRQSLGAICSLVAGGGADAASSLRQDLNALTSVYRSTASADLLAFHDGQLRLRQQRKLATEFANLQFVLLDDALWRVPLDYVLHERFYKRRYTDELGPRDTARWLGIRFWTRTIFTFAAARGYSWVMRIGRGARIQSPVAGDLFERVALSGAWYAYRLGGGCEPVQRADFFRLVQRYLLQHGVRPLSHLGCTQDRSTFHFSRISCGSMLHGALQADFFVANVSFWNTPAVQHFLEQAVDRSGAIWRFNWHEGFWHTMVVRIFAPPDRLLGLSSWTLETAAAELPRPAADEPFTSTAYMDVGTEDEAGPKRLRKFLHQGRRHTQWVAGANCSS